MQFEQCHAVISENNRSVKFTNSNASYFPVIISFYQGYNEGSWLFR